MMVQFRTIAGHSRVFDPVPTCTGVGPVWVTSVPGCAPPWPRGVAPCSTTPIFFPTTMTSFPDYYRILNIQKSATADEIRQAYKKESLK